MPHVLYLSRKPHDIKLGVHEGRVVLIVPNYTEVFEKPFETGDESVKVFRIEVPENEVLQQMDGGTNKLYLWLGDTGARSRPQDMLTLPVESLRSIVAPAPVAASVTPAEAVAAIFAGYSEDVRLAAVLANTPDPIVGAMFDISIDQVVAVKARAAGVLKAQAGG